ncbi:MAG: PTS sugar transporter subunit IIA [Planctomycetota bacterium]
MNISRFLKPSQIKLGLASGHIDQINPDKDEAAEKSRLKDEVIDELIELFDASGEIRNLSKFKKDFINREKADSTALENGISFPHIRSMQPRKTVIVFARSEAGVWFNSLDAELTHIFFGIAAPEYADKEMFRFHKWISNAFMNEDWLKDALLSAEDEHEIIKILGHLH